MLKEFRDFAMRGNVVDLAVGVIIGSAFTAIVNSLVNDIIMPPVGLLLGGVDFSELKVQLNAETAISYGVFINAVISFLIVAFVVFLLVRTMNRWQRGEEKETEPSTKSCPYCFTTIDIQATRCPNCTSELG